MKQHIPELDGIRGTAVLIILLFHWCGDGVLPPQIYNLAVLGWSGVDLFFVLSGYLIGGILIDARDSGNYFKVFYLRRFYRILPLYIAFLCIAFLCIAALIQNYASIDHSLFLGDALPWFTYLTFTQNFFMALQVSMGLRLIDHTWSLAVEEQFYLIIPFVIRYVRKNHLPYVLLAGIALAPVFRIFLYFVFGSKDSAIANYVLVFCRMDALLIGVLGAWLIRQDKKILSLKMLYSISLVLLAGMLFLTVSRVSFKSFLLISVGYSWIAMFYFSLLWIAVNYKESIVAKAFRLPVLTFFGALAYGVYLFQGIVLGLVQGLLQYVSPSATEQYPFLAVLPAGALLVGITHLSWHYFEKRFVKMGHKHKYEELNVVEVDTKLSVGAVL